MRSAIGVCSNGIYCDRTATGLVRVGTRWDGRRREDHGFGLELASIGVRRTYQEAVKRLRNHSERYHVRKVVPAYWRGLLGRPRIDTRWHGSGRAAANLQGGGRWFEPSIVHFDTALLCR